MIKINNKSYVISEDNFICEKHNKYQIIIGNSFSQNMQHIKGWGARHGGKFKRTAPYTIDIYGNIYEHYPPEYYSKFFGVEGIDEHIIPILIENEGWLVKDEENNEYLNYVGNIYNRKDAVINKVWRGQKYWAPYTKAQLDSAVKLSKYLCEVFNIKLETMAHNTKDESIYGFSGILYKSNFNRFYSDLSPAWDYKDFKNKIELK